MAIVNVERVIQETTRAGCAPTVISPEHRPGKRTGFDRGVRRHGQRQAGNRQNWQSCSHSSCISWCDTLPQHHEFSM